MVVYSAFYILACNRSKWRKLAPLGCNTLRTSVSPRQKESAVDGKVLRVSPSLQSSPQTVQDPSSVTTAADNLPQELTSSVTRGFTGSSGRPELIRRPDGRLHHHHGSILWPWPWPNDLDIWTWRSYTNFTCVFWKCTGTSKINFLG